MDKLQQEMIDRYKKDWGFEFMYDDTIESPQSFIEAWDYNIRWLRDKIVETEAIVHDYRNESWKQE